MDTIITRFRYEHLRNETHVQFHNEANALMEQFTPAALGIETPYAVYKPLFDEEVTALDQILKSAITSVLEDREQKRDRLLRGFESAVNAYLNHFDETKREAARKIKIILDRYGNIADKPYADETAAIEDLHTELLKQENFLQVATLGLGEWLGNLVQESRTFEALMMQRNVEWAHRPDLQMRKIRKLVDKAFRTIVDLLESLVRVKGPDTNKDFLAELNRRMKFYKDMLAQEAGHRHPIRDLGVGDHCVIEPIELQYYTGKPITVVPRVHYRDEGKPSVELSLGNDFEVTYKNNTNVGMAEVTVHGKGDYKGKVSFKFNIARK
jgi:hypothetical protein